MKQTIDCCTDKGKPRFLVIATCGKKNTKEETPGGDIDHPPSCKKTSDITIADRGSRDRQFGDTI